MLTWLGADRLRLAGGLDSELRYLRWIAGATLEGLLLYYPQLQFGGRGGGGDFRSRWWQELTGFWSNGLGLTMGH